MKTRMTVFAILFALTVGAAPLGTEFTYQGVLSDGGAPAAGVFDLRFLLYDAEVGGSQVGTIVYIEDLTVTDGRMTTQLDFGSVFDGTALWLEVSVRDGAATGAYTVLSPRQELTAAPFAQHAQTSDTADTAAMAGHATTAGDADTLDGQHGAYYLTWSNFVGIPTDIADGDDDTLGDMACSDGEIARWNGSAWVCSTDDNSPFLRTYVVGPVGNPVANGLALEQALGAINPVPVSQETAVLVRIEPGVYDLGNGTVALFPWMMVEGAGPDATRVTSAHCGTGFYEGTLWSSSTRVGLRDLTVENTCSDPTAGSIALSSQGNWLTLENVSLTANGTAEHNHAMFNSGSTVLIRGSSLHAENGTAHNQGLENWGADVTLVDVTVEVLDGSVTRGIKNEGLGFVFRGGEITLYGGTNDCSAFVNETDADSLVIADSVIWPFCVSGTNIGVYINGASARLTDVLIRGGDVGIWLNNQSSSSKRVQMDSVRAFSGDQAVWCQGANHSFDIDHGVFWGGQAVYNHLDECTVRIGATKLDGGVEGAATCAGVYDGGYAFYPDTCPAP